MRTGQIMDNTAWAAINNISRNQRLARKARDCKHKKDHRKKIINWQKKQETAPV